MSIHLMSYHIKCNMQFVIIHINDKYDLIKVGD
jgi:hypothetical protein